jgi:hypothetical protein
MTDSTNPFKELEREMERIGVVLPKKIQQQKQLDGHSMNPLEQLQRKVALLSFLLSIGFIVAVSGFALLTVGWKGILGTTDDFFYGLAFWLTAGVLAGLAQGKMTSVVDIGNAEGRRIFKSALDNLIVSFTCNMFIKQRLVQNNIINLFAPLIGVGIVWAVCNLLCAITGIAMLGVFPGGYLLFVVPFVVSWGVVAGLSRNAIVSRHFNKQR